MLGILIFIIIFNGCFYFTGAFCDKHHSKFPDTSVGYKSLRARKNNYTWVEADKYSGKVFRITFLITAVIQILLAVVPRALPEKTLYGLIIYLQIIAVVVSIFTIELHLKKMFH
ncbi:SdpI family protein [Clostridium sp. 19966]|uniref:SdpI family protein n=1 Tax=Clostridium sp. 19966 TaxID=2768166 RepID=UPI0028DE4772|nr:SdpI family protein [Clostridium sp. 19966]MDT8719547.1 SdpI family protein [Clostridium sp. 19966]